MTDKETEELADFVSELSIKLVNQLNKTFSDEIIKRNQKVFIQPIVWEVVFRMMLSEYYDMMVTDHGISYEQVKNKFHVFVDEMHMVIGERDVEEIKLK